MAEGAFSTAKKYGISNHSSPKPGFQPIIPQFTIYVLYGKNKVLISTSNTISGTGSVGSGLLIQSTGNICISSNAYNLVKDKFECTYRGKIDAKNIGQIDMYYLGKEIQPA